MPVVGQPQTERCNKLLFSHFTWLEEKHEFCEGLKMTMSTPVGPQGITLTQPIPVPTLTVLPPSSDTESWSRSPSPRPSRSSRHGRFHRSRTRTKRRNEEEQGLTSKQQWGKTPQIVTEESEEIRHQSPSPSRSVSSHMGEDEQRQDSPSQDLLLPPSRSWSRSPSPSRRSRWSLRSLLSRDSDWESCRLVGRIIPSWPIRGLHKGIINSTRAEVIYIYIYIRVVFVSPICSILSWGTVPVV